MHDAFMRAKADADNIRRRAQEDVARPINSRSRALPRPWCRCATASKWPLKVEAPTVESIKEGVEMTLKQLTAAFEKNRLVEVMPQPGDKLDPNKHQAVAVVPSEQEANTVVSVAKRLHDRRPPAASGHRDRCTAEIILR
jgi:molecular chaperone GrpE